MIKKEVKKKEISSEKRNLRLILSIFSFLLFLFFGLSLFHNWANLILIKLHFCDHLFCIIYSLIWFFSGIWNLFHYCKKDNLEENKKNLIEKEKKRLKKEMFIFILVLILGIFLMNIIPCDEYAKISFGLKTNDFYKDELGTNDSYEYENNNLEKNKDNFILNEENFSDSDDPFYPNGTLKSNFCLDYFNLRKYTSIESHTESNAVIIEDIDCREFYGPYSCCINGKCIANCTKEEYSCESYSEIYLDREYYGFVEEYGDEKCSDISNRDCDYGVEWSREHFDSDGKCCIWKCLENPPEPDIPEPDIPENFCQDSDEGLNPEIPGICNDGNSYTDYCIDNSKLMEFKCSEDICVGVEWQCKQKCIESESGAYCNETTIA
jgi:hypothetical protein